MTELISNLNPGDTQAGIDIASAYTAPLEDLPPEVLAEVTDTIQEYLETIYSMLDEGKQVIGARLAERMRRTPATVTVTLRGMIEQGLITMTAQKEVRFTAHGMQIARAVIRRHRLTERFLTDILGLEWHEAHEEAMRFEHAISPRTEQRIIRLLNNPTRCPHGNPIPGLAPHPPRNRMVLAQATVGARLVIERISEEAEIDPDLLAFLQHNHLVPDALLHVREVLPFNKTCSVQVGGQVAPVVVIGNEVAHLIWVIPEDELSERERAALGH
jgi:DtxR family Mn-dependent transcriptional regulator